MLNPNTASGRPLRVGLVSLGCAKNLVDAEIMLGSLIQNGIEITNDPALADALIVNTCSFIDAAQEESVDAILESDELRDAKNRGQALIVSGCLPQRFREELPKLLPEVDAFMGVDQIAQVPDIVRQALERRRSRLNEPSRNRAARKASVTNRLPKSLPAALPATPIVNVRSRPTFIPDFATPRFRLTPRHFAYVKIAEGCNHPCSFCIIPRMRGAHRSRPLRDIVLEAKQLIAEGVKELNLISQDSTYYGMDLRPYRAGSIAAPAPFQEAARALPSEAPALPALLRELNKLPGDFWIRILYTHPAHWTDELIQTIAHCKKVARYIDMPLQHIHENMLERMRRETSRDHIEQLIRRIRAGVPGIAIRTTFIVGFPGETESYFESLLDFIRETRFERLGVFTYSQEEGTRSSKMSGQVPGREKERRKAAAMAEQHRIAGEISSGFVGRTLRVLVEHEATGKELPAAQWVSWEHALIRDPVAPEPIQGRHLVARGEWDAPDIDGRVLIRGKMPLGQFATVKVAGHSEYDLLAVPA